MKQLKRLILTLLIGTFSLHAQNNAENFEKEFNDAEKTFSKIYDYSKAETKTDSKLGYFQVRLIFLKLFQQDTTNMNLAFKIGVCYQGSRMERAKATSYFIKAITSISPDYKGSSYKEKNAPIIAYQYLADAYHLDYQFDKSIAAYEKFITLLSETHNSDKLLHAETLHKIEMCKTGKSLISTPINVKIQNMGSAVNSVYADYSPVLSADQNTIFFTSRRPETTGSQKDGEGNFMEDIFMSTKTKNGWSNATNIGAPINTEWNEATVGTSPDGQTILIYKDDNGDGNIYSTTLNGDKWSEPVKLNENINTTYWEPSAFFSADGNSLYFVSNRPGGYGGRDIYISKRTPKGDWAKAQNLGPNINTQYDEDAPFIHADGITLSFSSNGHNTMGGFDIFVSLREKNGPWSEPQNVGYPVNTTDDDIFYVSSPNSRNAYFSSFREGGYGEKDNYMATFPNRKEAPLTLMIGTVTDKSGKPLPNVEIVVTDNLNGELVGVFHPNSLSGKYIFILTPGKNYNITYQAEDHLFYSENREVPAETNYYEIYRPIMLDSIKVGGKITLNNIFFDFDKATLRPLSNVEIKNLVAIMKKYPKMKVEISGHTDSKGSDEYNQKLSEQRAKAVVNRLIESGIPAQRMKAKGYGKTMPDAQNKNKDGTDNPEGRQLNRRVEFTITEIN